MSWPTRADARHAARWEPARVLAEVEAKRRQVELLEYQAGWNAEHDHQVTEHETTMMRTGATEHLRLMALPYAGHPDYDEAWRP